VSFWFFPGIDRSAPALIDETGRTVSYAELDEQAAQAARRLGPRSLGAIRMGNDAASLVTYLACLRAGHVPLLLARDAAPAQLAGVVAAYRPAWVAGPAEAAAPLSPHALPIRHLGGGPTPLHPDLALLLGTSGTTGSTQFVRLSATALEANARAIARYLALGPHERALTVLPPHYSYGLSVIHSHLAAGGCLVLSSASVLSPQFVETARRHGVTSLSGVPTTYQMLCRTGLQQQDLPALRTLTQAGGRLDERLVLDFSGWAARTGRRLFVMYGQTEATARISYVPPGQLAARPRSIGIAIPGGRLHVDAQDGELVYEGPNVMLGYAQEAADLLRGDELQGVLRTGDLGGQDGEGFFFLTGRRKRMLKLAGRRFSLDEVESWLQRASGLPAAVTGSDDRLLAFLEGASPELAQALRGRLAAELGVAQALVQVSGLASLPLLPNGKIDYRALQGASA
jgi:long-chain acyl-CoA synthetase